jgi:hypothetical protein
VEQGPSWEVNSFSASPVILHLFWNRKFNYRNIKISPLVSILSQIISVHAPSNFNNIDLNIIPSSTTGSSKWSFSPQVSPLTPCVQLSFPHTFYIPVSLIPLDFITCMLCVDQYVSVTPWLSPLISSWILVFDIILFILFYYHLYYAKFQKRVLPFTPRAKPEITPSGSFLINIIMHDVFYSWININ